MPSIQLFTKVVLLGLVSSVIAAIIPVDDLPGRKVEVQAHRGGIGLRPEETLYAFAYAMEVGAQVLEMDMVFTADEIPVIWCALCGPPLPEAYPSGDQARPLHSTREMQRHNGKLCREIHC